MQDIKRKSLESDDQQKQFLDISAQIFNYQRQNKNKVYSIHAPEIECVSKS